MPFDRKFDKKKIGVRSCIVNKDFCKSLCFHNHAVEGTAVEGDAHENMPFFDMNGYWVTRILWNPCCGRRENGLNAVIG